MQRNIKRDNNIFNDGKLGYKRIGERERQRERIKNIDSSFIEQLKELNLLDIVLINKNIGHYVNRLIQIETERKNREYIININIGQGLLHALVFNNVIEAILRDKKINKLFLRMNKALINVFLSCYTCSILNDGFFSQGNVLKYDKDITAVTLRGYFAELLKLNVIEQAPTNYIYNKTGKISKHINTAKEIKYYRFTAQGRAEIKKFIKVYTKKHEQITGNIYLNDLEKLKTDGFDEDF